MPTLRAHHHKKVGSSPLLSELNAPSHNISMEHAIYNGLLVTFFCHASSNVKMVHVLQEASACKVNLYWQESMWLAETIISDLIHPYEQLALCGQTPEVIAQASLEALNFYIKQQQLQHEFKENHLQKKVAKVQDACRKKLEEVHQGYQVVSGLHPCLHNLRVHKRAMTLVPYRQKGSTKKSCRPRTVLNRITKSFNRNIHKRRCKI
jgi:hypothetical protein